MARVTVEDCAEVVPNRFEMVLLAALRARQISAGSSLTVDRDKDKNPIIALREIAEKTVSVEELREGLIRGMQQDTFRDEAGIDFDELEEGLPEDHNLLENEAFDELSDEESDEENEEDDILSEQMTEAEAATHLEVEEIS